CTSAQNRHPAKKSDGFKRSPARDGSRTSASTVRTARRLTAAGSRAILKRGSEFAFVTANRDILRPTINKNMPLRRSAKAQSALPTPDAGDEKFSRCPVDPTIFLASLFCGPFWGFTWFNRKVQFSQFIA